MIHFGFQTDLYICFSVLQLQDLEDDRDSSPEVKLDDRNFKKYLDRDVYGDDTPVRRRENNLVDNLLKQIQNEQEDEAEDQTKNLRVFKHVDEDYDSSNLNKHHSWPSFEDLLKG